MVEVTVDEARQLKKQRLRSRLEKELEIDMVPQVIRKRTREPVNYAEEDDFLTDILDLKEQCLDQLCW